SKCFFLGPIISSVVALQTAFARPWPAILCLAASNLSLIVCPAIVIIFIVVNSRLSVTFCQKWQEIFDSSINIATRSRTTIFVSIKCYRSVKNSIHHSRFDKMTIFNVRT
ncbi:hypothetical protein KQX54_014524, partial [Cotesia glomerata]